jgi:hypothetical protein
MRPNGLIRSWWHSLWRTFTPGHRMVSYVFLGHRFHFCECGYGMDRIRRWFPDKVLEFMKGAA